MIFSQSVFFVFFAAFAAVYLVARRHVLGRNLVILCASYIFYGWWDPRFLTLIAVSTAVDYVAGRVIAGERPTLSILTLPSALLATVLMTAGFLSGSDWMMIAALGAICPLALSALLILTSKTEERARARIFLTVSIASNLGLLCVFKYFDFFAAEFSAIAQVFGWTPDPMTLGLVLPVGISFYTFQTMSYTIDIWRRQMEPTRDYVQFAAFVSFFPQLVAGPIERARNLLPQFAEVRPLAWDRIQSGAMLFLWGFYKKAVIADNLAPISDRVFSNPSAAAPEDLLAGVLAFTFQIYCDFSGYSDMARGIARMLGFDLMLNFNMPYFSRSPSEFWQRWHISLSSWLRDYLYIPLGGNRFGGLLTYRNLVITMLLGGLWHGAAWTFIAWGGFHGAILVVYRIAGIDRWLSSHQPGSPAHLLSHTIAASLMFLLVVISWVFFRAATFPDAFHILTNMWVLVWSPVLATVAFYVLPLVIAEAAARFSNRLVPWERVPRFVSLNVVLFAFCAALFLTAKNGQQFIYFDF